MTVMMVATFTAHYLVYKLGCTNLFCGGTQQPGQLYGCNNGQPANKHTINDVTLAPSMG